jgi:tyrosine decarboxylase/aspartate 1-decarboxylase
MKFLGREGYRKVVGECMDNTGYLVKRVRELGLGIPMKPLMNIVCINLKDVQGVFNELVKLDWKASVTRDPQCLRIVVMPHVTKKVVDQFIPDLESVCKELNEI